MKQQACRPTAKRLWVAAGPGLAALVVLLGACSSASTTPVSTGQPSSSSSSPQAISVTSTLDGHTALPHRIQWIATPSGAEASEVDFLIDGKQFWVENNAPYYYGDDGNYLVTSFLKPGKHDFTVRAIGLGGQTATDSVTATVPAAPPPLAALAGTWKAWQPAAPAGYVTLIISSEGWSEGDFPVTQLCCNREDVAYLSPGLVEIRTGMATGHIVRAGPGDGDLNGWCNNAPGSPARYRWSVSGTHLRLTFAGGHPCPGFTKWLTAAWTRVS